jgi:glutathione S-transferase
MKLFYAPGACSLADHIALTEGSFLFELESVDLALKRTATGIDFHSVNPKGYVPALILDSGELLTENVAILDWIATQSPSLTLEDPMGRTRILEALAYISDELHSNFKPMFHAGDEELKASARTTLVKRLDWMAGQMKGDFLFGAQVTVADCFLLVMLLWARDFAVPVKPGLIQLRDRMLDRPAVRAAIATEEWRTGH